MSFMIHCERIWSSIYAFPLLGQVLLDDANDGTLRHLPLWGDRRREDDPVTAPHAIKGFSSATFVSEALDH
jgi:hypothetical protein